MSLLYIPQIREIVLDACKDLIDEYSLSFEQKAPNVVYLTSPDCGLKIVAGISPIGEREMNVQFFDPKCDPSTRKYYSDLHLLYVRAEPRDIVNTCPEEKESFDDTLRDALECFTRHTLKYRKDILSGDFTSWLPKTN